MDNLISLLKASVCRINPIFYGMSADEMSSQYDINVDVKNKILEVIQTWALAFEGRPHLAYVMSIYNKLKSDGTTV